MEKIDFVIGQEKRFYNFISKMGKEKIALVSHTDLDGIASAKIANKVLNADIMRFVDYHELNGDLIEELKREKVKKVIFTDLFIRNKEFLTEIEKFAEILIIDHHLAKEDLNSNRIVFLNAQGYCSAYLCYYLFAKIQDLHKLNWFVACACIADYLYEKNKSWMNKVFEEYDDKFFIDFYGLKESRFWKLHLEISLAIIYWKTKGKLIKVIEEIGDRYGDIGNLREVARIVQKEIDNAVKRFEEEKEEINGRLFWEFKPIFEIGSFISNLMCERYPDKTIIIARIHEKYYNFSARREDGGENVDELLRKLIVGFDGAEGGGHFKAAGGHILLKDRGKFLERLRNL